MPLNEEGEVGEGVDVAEVQKAKMEKLLSSSDSKPPGT